MKDIYVNKELIVCDGETKSPFEDQKAIRDIMWEQLFPPFKELELKTDTFYQIEADWEIVEIPIASQSPTPVNVGRVWTDVKKVARLKVPAPTVATDNRKPLKEWTALEIAIYAVHCGNEEAKIEEVEKMIKEYASPVEEEQNKLWKELIDLYDIQDASSYGYGVLINKLSEKFILTRKEKV